MTEDVVELAQGWGHVENAELLEVDVRQCQGLNGFQSFVNLDLGEIDPDELAAGQLEGHGDQVSAGRAADFENPTVLRLGARRVEPVS